MGMPEDQHPPLWKQLLGAATGATVALLLYGGFVVASPHLSVFTAYLSSNFEESIKHLPEYRSPRTIREEMLERKKALGDRARAATERLQKGKKYFAGASSSSVLFSSSTASVPPLVVHQEEKEVSQRAPPKDHTAKKQDQPHSEKKTQKKSDVKRKEDHLPSTGVPLWAILGVAFGLALSMRYRRELLRYEHKEIGPYRSRDQ